VSGVRTAKRQRRKARPQLAYQTTGGKPLPKEEGEGIVLEASERFRQRFERVSTRVKRLDYAPDRASVEKGMLLVERKLVKALWVIERSTIAERPRGYEGRNGIEYGHDHTDTHARYTDAPGGKYESQAPRPALPDSKEITEARSVQRWIELIDDSILARVFTVGAQSKCGDAGRRVSWIRVRSRLPELRHYSERSLRHFYNQALRYIVAELAMQRKSA
jgi:hypothetical protein